MDSDAKTISLQFCLGIISQRLKEILSGQERVMDGQMDEQRDGCTRDVHSEVPNILWP